MSLIATNHRDIHARHVQFSIFVEDAQICRVRMMSKFDLIIVRSILLLANAMEPIFRRRLRLAT
jgi:hypothetical protein